MTGYNDPKTPDYLKADLLRMMNRLAANEHWYKQVWMGVPIWQMPDDLMRLQAIVAEVRPKWIVETGTKFGGSAIFFASLLKLQDRTDGGVITVDLTAYPEAESHLTAHACASLIKGVVVGDAASAEVVTQVQSIIRQDDGPTLVFLDDNHNADHVQRELELYSPLVTPGSYLIVADTVFADLAGTPVGAATAKYPDVAKSNPRVALDKFLASRDDFVRDDRFIGKGMGNFSDGFLRRLLR